MKLAIKKHGIKQKQSWRKESVSWCWTDTAVCIYDLWVCSQQVHEEKKSKFLSSMTSLLLLGASSVAVELCWGCSVSVELQVWFKYRQHRPSGPMKENTSACSSFRCMLIMKWLCMDWNQVCRHHHTVFCKVLLLSIGHGGEREQGIETEREQGEKE